MDKDIKILTISLESVINRTKILPDGRVMEIRFMVDQVNNLKIIIHPNEHAPPHFHVTADGWDATIGIKDCKVLKGNISSKDLKKIEYWHGQNVSRLVETWSNS